MRHDEPRQDEVEQADGVHCQRFLALWLTVAQELCRGKSSPNESDHGYDEPQEEEEGGLCGEEYHATHHQRQSHREHAVSQHAHRLEERDVTTKQFRI